MADANVSALQIQINRFYGVTIGSPITVDGVVGQQTAGALSDTLDYMSTLDGWQNAADQKQQLVGANGLDTGLITSSASDLAAFLKTFADAQGYTEGVIPSAGGGGAQARVPTTHTFPKASAAATNVTTQLQLLPTWAKIGGGLVLVLIAYAAGKALLNRRRRSLHGFGLGHYDLADVLRAAKPRAKVAPKKRKRRELPIIDV